MLPLVLVLFIIAVIIVIAGPVVLWLTGLFIASLFFIIGVMLLYALHEMDALDVQQDRWLLVFPAIMFFIGLGLDKVGVLSLLWFQPLTFVLPGLDFSFTLNLEVVLLLIILCLSLVDIAVSKS
jgi:hypothetical protein